MAVPTQARFLNDVEWRILQDVFGDTLPYRQRILITDGLGGGDAPFTIPTSAISLATIPAAVQAALTSLVIQYLGGQNGIVARAVNSTGFTGPLSLLSETLGMVNLGFIVSVGPTPYPDMAVSHDALLVHELSHVWQGKNSRSSMTYVTNSIMHQCRATIFGSSRNGAYDYPANLSWSQYNTEQQASIIENWYKGGKRTDSPLFPFIRDYVRKGLT